MLPVFSKFCSLIATESRLLAVNQEANVALIDISENPARYDSNPGSRMLGSAKLSDRPTNSYSHPALVGNALYLRTSQSLTAWRIMPE